MGRNYILGNQVVFDKLKREITDKDTVVNIGGREAAILSMLYDNGNQVLRKDEINQHVWGKVFVSETSLTKAVSNLRKSLAQFNDISCEIKTIPKEGYMLIIDHSITHALAQEPSPDTYVEKITKTNKVFPNKSDNTTVSTVKIGLHSSIPYNQRIFWVKLCFTSALIAATFTTAIIMVLR
ncbi:winged helix-turn-helix domain-containing protein [Shewanella sp. VB17]|uniref:winged helix-turn-helix domain-containing protein n=1 Tax=Shewanella sp. VB17 TaxID=2739432 RepID=UPI0015634265|nr:winged helix-turn-helix domain-containing protein [Shewanella sp. VB17]NRD72555.1 winged helix-turn-helix domain-containing protein [Shewanella sp. VB17]